MENLPRETIVSILSFLDPPVLRRTARNVCRLWANISSELHESRSISFSRNISARGNWIKFDIAGAGAPPPLYAAQCKCVDGKLYVIGGNPGLRTKVYVLFLDTMRWKCPKTYGSRPMGIGFRSVVYWKKEHKLVLYGMCKPMHDFVHFLDVTTMMWERAVIRSEVAISHRTLHCAVIDEEKNEMYVFGGLTVRQRVYAEDMWVLDLVTLRWRVVRSTDDGPCQRHSFSMHEVFDKGQKLKSILVFGGVHHESLQPIALNDVWLLDIETKCWTEMKTTGMRPAPTFYGGSKVVRSQLVVIAGWGHFKLDTFVLNLENWEWKKPSVKNLPPMRRFYAVEWIECEACLLLFGGLRQRKRNDKVYNDLHKLSALHL